VHDHLRVLALHQNLHALSRWQTGFPFEHSPLHGFKFFPALQQDPYLEDLVVLDGDCLVSGATLEEMVFEAEVIRSDGGGHFARVDLFLGQGVAVVDFDEEVEHALEELGVQPGGVEDEVELMGGVGMEGDWEGAALVVSFDFRPVSGNLRDDDFQPGGGVLHEHLELPHLQQSVVLDVHQLGAEDSAGRVHVEQQQVISG
jgi:hypothetical protein